MRQFFETYRGDAKLSATLREMHGGAATGAFKDAYAVEFPNLPAGHSVTVRLATQLKTDAERTLDSLGLSMSSAIRVFLTQIVAQNALPFSVQAVPVPAAAEDVVPLDVPLHVHIEVMLEEIAVISARLQQLEQAEPAPDKRKELRDIGKAVRAIQSSSTRTTRTK